MATCLALSLLLAFSLNAQQTLTLSLTVHAGDFDRTGTPVCTKLPDKFLNRDGQLSLAETSGGGKRSVAVQRSGNQICWILSENTEAGSTRNYQVSMGSPETIASTFRAHNDGRAVTMAMGEQPLLTYQYGEARLPAGVDQIYARGGFIHPLLSPRGDTLTRIQPADHYHHYGLWNPWTHTEYDGREVDFWNLARGQGRVVTDEVKEAESGPVYARVTARSHYLINRDSAVTENALPVLEERLQLTTYPAGPDGAYLVDYRTEQENITELPLTVKAYRYQGFGFRARADWNDESAQLLTSAGRDKSDGNGTRARWMKLSGPTEHGKAGILFMAHPDNYNSPEQIRIWPTGMNGGKENVFVNFNPAQDRDYRLRPAGKYSLDYRLLVYEGELDTTRANQYWQDFAYPPRVTVEGENRLKGKRILLYTKNGKGFVHKNIPASIAAIQKLGEENDFTVVASEDPGLFTPEGLEDFDVLVFSNTNNEAFDTREQQLAFKNYIAGGGGFVGIHSACGSERDWPWFWRNLGGKFWRHAKRQDFDVRVIDADHPSTDFLPATWHIKDDECYYLKQLNPAIQVLLAADLNTVDDEQGSTGYPADTFGSNFPTSWCHTTDGGRQWYTSLGHKSEHYSDPLLMRHILGGIEWAANKN